MKLIFKSADYALTRSVMYGTLQGCRDGMISCTGLMTNFPWSKHAADLIKEYPHVCLGQDINITVGRPISDPKDIPSLVNDDGSFVNSSVHRSNKVDQVVFEEAVLETEAQVKKFIEYRGHIPEYMQSHANNGSGKVIIQNAITFIAKKYGVKQYAKVREKLMYAPKIYDIPFPKEVQEKRSLEEDLINDRYGILNCGKDIVILNTHCGYVDKDIEACSSFTIVRADDLKAVCSDKVRKWMIANNIELASFRDIPSDDELD